MGAPDPPSVGTPPDGDAPAQNAPAGLAAFPVRFCPRCGARMEERPVQGRVRPVCPNCGFVYFLDPKVAVGTIVTWQGGVVLGQRAIEPGRGKWVFPGGFVDRGETLEAAAIRETREETTLDIRLTGLLNVYSYPESIVVVVVYEAEATGDPTRPGGYPATGDECLDVRAFPPEAIPWDDLAFRSTREALAAWCLRRGLPAPG